MAGKQEVSTNPVIYHFIFYFNNIHVYKYNAYQYNKCLSLNMITHLKKGSIQHFVNEKLPNKILNQAWLKVYEFPFAKEL